MLKTNRIFMALLAIFVLLSCAGCGTEQAKAPETPKKKEILKSGLIAYKPDDLLILDSDLIMTGTVSKIGESKWSNPDFHRGDEIRNILQTDIYVTVDNVLYGDCETDTIAVRADYGEDETTIVYSDCEPVFTIGEQILLFLARDRSDVATDEDYYILVGMNQGKFNLRTNLSTQTGQVTPKTGDGAWYVNLKSYGEQRSFLIGELKARIAAEHAARPNYRQERAIKEAEIQERNKVLFGE